VSEATEKEVIRHKFYNTFLLNDDSREVMAYIKTNFIDCETHSIEVQLAFRKLYDEILGLCGVAGNKKILDKLAIVAAEHIDPKGPKGDKEKGLHDIID